MARFTRYKTGQSFVVDKSGSFGRSLFAKLLWWLVLLALLVGAYLAGLYRAGLLAKQGQEEELSWQGKLAALQQQNDRLIAQNAELQSSTQVDRDAQKQVKESLLKAQAEVASMREELEFYRATVAPTAQPTAKKGLQVQSLNAKKDKDGNYQFELMLTRGDKDNKESRGSVDMRFEGKLNGRSVIYALSDVMKGKDKRLRYKFKQFQKFQGVWDFRKGFRPQSVSVVVDPRGRNSKNINRRFTWQTVLN